MSAYQLLRNPSFLCYGVLAQDIFVCPAWMASCHRLSRKGLTSLDLVVPKTYHLPRKTMNVLVLKFTQHSTRLALA